jgi:hypothetical protein
VFTHRFRDAGIIRWYLSIRDFFVASGSAAGALIGLRVLTWEAAEDAGAEVRKYLILRSGSGDTPVSR